MDVFISAVEHFVLKTFILIAVIIQASAHFIMKNTGTPWESTTSRTTERSNEMINTKKGNGKKEYKTNKNEEKMEKIVKQ